MPIAFSAAVAPTTESMTAETNAVQPLNAVGAADAVVFDVVTPHPEGHNLNSMQSLPFYN